MRLIKDMRLYIDYVATPTCMVKVASERRGKGPGGVTGNETSERVKYRVTKSRGPSLRSAR